MPRIEVEMKKCIHVNKDTGKAETGREVKVEIDEANDVEVLMMLASLIHTLHTRQGIPEIALLAVFKTAFDPEFRTETLADSE